MRSAVGLTILLSRLRSVYRTGRFIVNNFRQAKKLIADLTEELNDTMQALSIPSTATFYDWIREEREYLEGLPEEPALDLLKVEYLDALRKLQQAK